MVIMGKGMLDGLFTPQYRDLRQDELDEENRLLRLDDDPFNAMALAAYSSGRQAGLGLWTDVAAGGDKDPRSPLQRHSEAVEAAKAQVASLGLDPDKPETIDQFYRQVIQILQKQGLAAEALQVGKEYQEQKSKRARDDIALRDLKRKE